MSDEKVYDELSDSFYINAIELLKYLVENEKYIDVCMINNNSEIISELYKIPKNSASKSRTFFAKLLLPIINNRKSIPISLKVFIESKDNSSLEYEAKMYKLITENIIHTKQSPNFVSFVAYGCCKQDQVNEEFKKLKNLNKEDNICILMTEKIGNGMNFNIDKELKIISLEKFLSKEFEKEYSVDLNLVFFQIFYSLEVLRRHRIMHNDLHYQNIILMEIPNYDNIVLGFEIDGVKYKISTRYIPYIFDWDYSYSEDIGDNPLLESFENIALTNLNEYRNNADLYTILCFSLKSYHSFRSSRNMNNLQYLKLPKLMLLKENQNPNPIFELTEEEYKKIISLREYIIDEKTQIKIYKLSGYSLQEIIGDKINNINDNILTIYFFVYSKHGKYYLYLYNPHECRMNSISGNLESALTILKKYFSYYITNNFDGINPKFIYKMPTQIKTRRTVYIDPHFAKRGKERLKTIN